MLEPAEYRQAESHFRAAYELCRPLLSEDARRHITHYVDHGELEMAFEGLGLALLDENIPVPSAAKGILYPLAFQLGLDKETVFDNNFWQRFEPLLKNSNE